MVHHALIVELQQWDAVEKVLYKHRRGREIRQAKERFDHKVKKEKFIRKIQSEREKYGPESTQSPTSKPSSPGPSGCPGPSSQQTERVPSDSPVLSDSVSIASPLTASNSRREKLHDKRLGEEPRLKVPTRAHLTKPHHPLRNEVLASSVHDGKDKGKDAEAESSTHESAGNTPEVPPQTALNHAPESTSGLVHNPRNSKRLPSDSYNQGTKAKRQNYGLAQEIGVYRVQQKLLEMHHDATSKLASGKGKERSNDS